MARLGLNSVRIDENALALLLRYSWPGNVRELENIISRSALKASSEKIQNGFIIIQPNHLAGDLGTAMYTVPAPTNNHPPTVTCKISLREELKTLQIRLINSSLDNNNGNWAAAARDLDMNRSNLHNLATRLGIRKKQQLAGTKGS